MYLQNAQRKTLFSVQDFGPGWAARKDGRKKGTIGNANQMNLML